MTILTYDLASDYGRADQGAPTMGQGANLIGRLNPGLPSKPKKLKTRSSTSTRRSRLAKIVKEHDEKGLSRRQDRVFTVSKTLKPGKKPKRASKGERRAINFLLMEDFRDQIKMQVSQHLKFTKDMLDPTLNVFDKAEFVRGVEKNGTVSQVNIEKPRPIMHLDIASCIAQKCLDQLRYLLLSQQLPYHTHKQLMEFFNNDHLRKLAIEEINDIVKKKVREQLDRPDEDEKFEYEGVNITDDNGKKFMFLTSMAPTTMGAWEQDPNDPDRWTDAENGHEAVKQKDDTWLVSYQKKDGTKKNSVVNQESFDAIKRMSNKKAKAATDELGDQRMDQAQADIAQAQADQAAHAHVHVELTDNSETVPTDPMALHFYKKSKALLDYLTYFMSFYIFRIQSLLKIESELANSGDNRYTQFLQNGINKDHKHHAFHAIVVDAYERAKPLATDDANVEHHEHDIKHMTMESSIVSALNEAYCDLHNHVLRIMTVYFDVIHKQHHYEHLALEYRRVVLGFANGPSDRPKRVDDEAMNRMFAVFNLVMRKIGTIKTGVKDDGSDRMETYTESVVRNIKNLATSHVNRSQTLLPVAMTDKTLWSDDAVQKEIKIMVQKALRPESLDELDLEMGRRYAKSKDHEVHHTREVGKQHGQLVAKMLSLVHFKEYVYGKMDHGHLRDAMAHAPDIIDTLLEVLHKPTSFTNKLNLHEVMKVSHGFGLLDLPHKKLATTGTASAAKQIHIDPAFVDVKDMKISEGGKYVDSKGETTDLYTEAIQTIHDSWDLFLSEKRKGELSSTTVGQIHAFVKALEWHTKEWESRQMAVDMLQNILVTDVKDQKTKRNPFPAYGELAYMLISHLCSNTGDRLWKLRFNSGEAMKKYAEHPTDHANNLKVFAKYHPTMHPHHYAFFTPGPVDPFVTSDKIFDGKGGVGSKQNVAADFTIVGSFLVNGSTKIDVAHTAHAHIGFKMYLKLFLARFNKVLAMARASDHPDLNFKRKPTEIIDHTRDFSNYEPEYECAPLSEVVPRDSAMEAHRRFHHDLRPRSKQHDRPKSSGRQRAGDGPHKQGRATAHAGQPTSAHGNRPKSARKGGKK